jgi:hypothetical protein
MFRSSAVSSASGCISRRTLNFKSICRFSCSVCYFRLVLTKMGMWLQILVKFTDIKFYENPSVGVALFRADRWTEGQVWRSFIVAFCNCFTNVTKNKQTLPCSVYSSFFNSGRIQFGFLSRRTNPWFCCVPSSELSLPHTRFHLFCFFNQLDVQNTETVRPSRNVDY